VIAVRDEISKVQWPSHEVATHFFEKDVCIAIGVARVLEGDFVPTVCANRVKTERMRRYVCSDLDIHLAADPVSQTKTLPGRTNFQNLQWL